MIEIFSFAALGDTGRPQRPLELISISLRGTDFTTNFDPLMVCLERLQNEKHSSIQRLLDNIDINREKSIDEIVAQNVARWRGVMYNKHMPTTVKLELFKELNKTVYTAVNGISDLIKDKRNEARELYEQIDNNDLIANISTFVQNTIEKQEKAAIKLLKLIRNLGDEINLLYTKPEQVFNMIDAKLNSFTKL